jgi:L-alanine-DL-glutamate epimerase-like enolase superfamily enzyme
MSCADADGGWRRAPAEVAHALKDELEMIEQPTPPDDLTALCEVTRNSLVPGLSRSERKRPIQLCSWQLDRQ